MLSLYRMRRLGDIIGALVGLVLSLPLWPLIALAIRLDSRGPSIIKLARVSSGKTIWVYKFRSMQYNTHHLKFTPEFAMMNERRDGPFFKIKNDPRLTRVGRILRKFRIDEVPQLINVLKGEMALVGPRPHEPEEIIHYPDKYKHIVFARAGITGLSQVSGASGLPFLKELELDSYYVNRRSLWLDTKILAKTIAILFFDPTAV